MQTSLSLSRLPGKALAALLLLLTFDARLSPAATEIYLLDGGINFLTLERSLLGGVRMGKTSLAYGQTLAASAVSDNGALRHMELSTSFPAGGSYVMRTSYWLTPSKSAPGDWDLLRVAYASATDPGKFTPEKEPPPEANQSARVLRYAHRIDEPLVLEYFSDRQTSSAQTRGLDAVPDTPQAARLFALAGKMLAAHPNDCTIRVLYLDALVRTSRFEELAQKLASWQSDFLSSNNPCELYVFRRAQQTLRSRQLSAQGKNAADFLERVFSPKMDLAACLRLFPQLLNYCDFAHPVAGLTIWPLVPNFLDYQVQSKVLCIEAIFYQLHGQRAEALTLLAATYRMGQLLCLEPTTDITRLIGTAVRTIAAHQLISYALNSCETPEECLQLWRMLEYLAQLPVRVPSSPSDVSPLAAVMQAPQKEGQDTRPRMLVAETKFQLLRAATAARYRLLTTGSFPAQPSAFAPPLTQTIPTDPFTSAPLLFSSYGAQAFICHSVGPDQKDNGARIEYDPTNGTLSAGDILLRVPAQRDFPYPRQGVHAASKQQLLQLFPKRLPPDIFADTRGRSLGITDTRPVMVYSFGPDTSEFEASRDERGAMNAAEKEQNIERYVPKVAYDPTNGLISPGDLVTVLAP